jgi:hypothetical protein
VCRWGLGISGLGQSVISFGGRFGYTDAGQTPNTQVCVFNFGDKTIISETRGLKTPPYMKELKGVGTIFEGTKGIIAGASLFDLDGKLVSTFEGKGENHFANFLNAVRSRKREDLNAEILEGHQSSALCHIGNISWRLGRTVSPAELRSELGKLAASDKALETLDRTLEHLRDNKVDVEQTKITLGPHLALDSQREAFIANPKADALLSREYRKPFVVPAESEV